MFMRTTIENVMSAEPRTTKDAGEHLALLVDGEPLDELLDRLVLKAKTLCRPAFSISDDTAITVINGKVSVVGHGRWEQVNLDNVPKETTSP